MRTALTWLLLVTLLALAGERSDAGTTSRAPTGDRPTARAVEARQANGHRSTALGFRHYVAIGDSYTSGAGIPPAHMGGCFTSRRNYPHLLSRRLGARVTDVSCGGASTASLVTPQPTSVGPRPPQLDALSRRSDLVTFSLGINDAGFQTIITRCAEVAEVDAEGAPCRQSFATPAGDVLLSGLPEVRRRVVEALRMIQDKAPHATVVLVGYPQLVPDDRTCPALPFAAGDYAYLAEFFAAVDTALASAARAADVTYVSLLEPSLGHDVCAGPKAWELGSLPAPGAMRWHPFLREQRAASRLIRRALEEAAHQQTSG